MATERLQLELWFLEPDIATIDLESSIADPEAERFYEICLFALFAARQVVNLRRDGELLAATLSSVGEDQGLRHILRTRGGIPEVREALSLPRAGRHKGFTCVFRPGNRQVFKLQPHGFGLLGKDVSRHAFAATLGLLTYLERRRGDDAAYQTALGRAAALIGEAGSSGAVRLATQQDVALMKASEAWITADHQGAAGSAAADPWVPEQAEDDSPDLERLMEDVFDRVPEDVVAGMSRTYRDDVKSACQHIARVAAGELDDDVQSAALAMSVRGYLCRAANEVPLPALDADVRAAIEGSELNTAIDASRTSALVRALALCMREIPAYRGSESLRRLYQERSGDSLLVECDPSRSELFTAFCAGVCLADVDRLLPDDDESAGDSQNAIFGEVFMERLGPAVDRLFVDEENPVPDSRDADALYAEASDLFSPFLDWSGHHRAASPDEARTVRRVCQLLEEAIDIDLSDWQAHWLLGFAHRFLGDHEAAFHAFRSAYKLEKENDSPGREYCRECLALNRTQEAISVAQQLVVRHPHDAGLKANLGLALLTAGQLQEGARWITDAHTIDPDDPMTGQLNAVGQLLAEGRIADAEALAAKFAAAVRSNR